jgi:hypothetical protein
MEKDWHTLLRLHDSPCHRHEHADCSSTTRRSLSDSLDDLVIRIGRMISYQEYNTKSPLNGLAAKWAAQNAGLLPIDTRSIAPPSSSAEKTEEPASNVQTPPAEPAASEPPSDPWSQKISIN